MTNWSDQRFENLIHPMAIMRRQADEDGACGLPCWLNDSFNRSSERSRIYGRSYDLAPSVPELLLQSGRRPYTNVWLQSIPVNQNRKEAFGMEGASMYESVKQPLNPAGASTMNITTVGIDFAKSVFQVHRIDEWGKAVLRKQVRRAELVHV